MGGKFLDIHLTGNPTLLSLDFSDCEFHSRKLDFTSQLIHTLVMLPLSVKVALARPEYENWISSLEMLNVQI